MKNFFLVTIAALLLCMGACDSNGAGGSAGGGGFLPDSPLRSRYTLGLPELPPAWASLLGAPEWRLEWVNNQGVKQEALIQRGKTAEITLGETWTSPVSAWPYWPDRGIAPGTFRPAGALFPFDAAGNTISLSWQGGVDAVLYWELARAESSARAAVPRLPQNFNWPRFRELFTEKGGINEDVRVNPWLADWPAIAAKIAASGFDKRRLVPEKRGELQVPVGPGPWAGTSPFAEPLCFDETPVFPVRKTTGALSVDTWVSAQGLLRCNTETWILLPWD